MLRGLTFGASALVLVLGSATSHGASAGEPGGGPPLVRRGSFDSLIPRPTRVTPVAGEFALSEDTTITIAAGAEAGDAADLLREYLRPATGLRLAIEPAGTSRGRPSIVFTSQKAPRSLGSEGYELRIEARRVEIVAREAAGFGFAVQTIRQILPAEIESQGVQPGTWTLPAGTIRDVPRFAWRGAMLDVARHFFTPPEVKRVIDLLALYKMNRFHLHLTDDQGWRIQIRKYPALTEIGAQTALGGGPGGFYTQQQYRDLVDYAARRGVVVVPEIDVPGHTQAALASIPALSCDGQTREVNTGHSSLTSTLCVERERTYRFVKDVLTEIGALTPGPYIHLGADESTGTEHEAYRTFVARATEIVRDLGKEPLVWDEAAVAELGPNAIAQFWFKADNARAAVAQDVPLVMSPASRTYLDMKYDESTPIGTNWAGFIDTRTAYEWDPASQVPGIAAAQVLGLEAPVWTETISTIEQVELMILPRIPAYAELGWSTPAGKSWDDFRTRVAPHGRRWDTSGHTFTRDPGIDWR